MNKFKIGDRVIRLVELNGDWEQYVGNPGPHKIVYLEPDGIKLFNCEGKWSPNYFEKYTPDYIRMVKCSK